MSNFIVKPLGVCLLVFLLSSCMAKNSNDWKHIEQQVQKLMNKHDAEIALFYKNLYTGETFQFNEEIVMHAASTMKVPVMMELYKQAHLGNLSLSDSVVVKNEFSSIVDGSPYSMDVDEDSDSVVYKAIGKKMTLYDLCFAMITTSSNFATNILIDILDAKKITATMRDVGASQIEVLRGVEDIKAFEKGLNNTTTAKDLGIIMETIATKKFTSTKLRNDMLTILEAQKIQTKIPALLPPTTWVAHKTGSITKIDHDAAILYPQHSNPYVLVVMTRGISDHKVAQQTIATISKKIHDKQTDNMTQDIKTWFWERADKDAVVIDVRTFEEYESGHIDDALLIPYDEIAALIEDQVADKSKEILLYCRSGNRSGIATRTLQKMGYTNVYNAGSYNILKRD